MNRLVLPLLALTLPLFGCPGGDDSGSDSAADSGSGTGTPATGGTMTPMPTQGDDGGPGGTGPNATSDGSGDTGTEPPPDMVCQHQCTGDGDCTVSGLALGYTCDGGKCSGSECVSDELCIPVVSGWVIPCTSGGGECDAAMQVCVDIGGGEGRCATPAVNPCQNPMSALDVLDIDGAPAMVCGFSNAKCGADGVCIVPCTDMSCGAASAYPNCNSDTGRCECTSNADCAKLGTEHMSVCVDGRCGCSTDDSCFVAGLGDVCGAGICGCSGDDACVNVEGPYDGGSIVCAGS